MIAKIGEIRIGYEVGFNSHKKVMWCACADCGKERWVFLRNGKPQSNLCFKCGRKKGGATFGERYFGDTSSGWKGGRRITGEGYILLTLAPDDPFIGMARSKRNRTVFEHRLVVARHLGRLLDRSEKVHHKNRNRQDNRIENLQLISDSDHSRLHHDMETLRSENEFLKKEIARLRKKLNG